MEMYLGPILKAFWFFPIIAFLFTIPYILWQYHKYGSIPFLRVIIVYSFILYLICAYFLVILPLPSYEKVANLTTPTTQLIPFYSIYEMIQNTNISAEQVSTYFQVFHQFMFFQVLFNIILTLPFGIYLRYYFKCNLKKTVLYTFLLSLFFELTQLTGLYFIYPRAYRIFDIDDLIFNTLGGLVGYWICKLFFRILPSRDEIDQMAFDKGQKVSFLKRSVAFLFDLSLFFMINTFVMIYFYLSIHQYYLVITFLIFLLYYIFIPIINNGSTLGNRFLNLKISGSENDAKGYQIFLRNFLLYFIYLPSPIYVLFLFKYGLSFVKEEIIIAMVVYLLLFFVKLMIDIIKAILDKPLLYEKISKTKLKSTIKRKEV